MRRPHILLNISSSERSASSDFSPPTQNYVGWSSHSRSATFLATQIQDERKPLVYVARGSLMRLL